LIFSRHLFGSLCKQPLYIMESRRFSIYVESTEQMFLAAACSY
jgi:hypothetical protein